MKTYEVEKHSQLVYRLMGLPMAGAVLHIGAHPDDEDIGLLAYLSCKYGVRAVYWSATRGEGGQNRIGPYTDEALGIYRTWESLAARSLAEASVFSDRSMILDTARTQKRRSPDGGSMPLSAKSFGLSDPSNPMFK